MATADELLVGLMSATASHKHPVIDSDAHFIIDPITRQITNAYFETNILIENDHNSARYTFELPRYVDGHDMLLCDKVFVHFNNYSEATMVEYKDTYQSDDLRINPNDESTVICSWLISRYATRQSGDLSFLVQYMCTEEGNEEPVYEFHTDIYTHVEVKPGRDNGEAAVLKHSNVLLQWEERIFGAEDSVIENIKSVSDVQQADIEAKGKATLATIPEDYTTTHEMADEALRRKAEAIVLSASGENIVLDDSSCSYLLGLNLYGRTTQFKTTGAQLINPTNYNNPSGSVVNGVTVTVNADDSVTLTGTMTADITLFSENLLDSMTDGKIYATNTTFQIVENGITRYNRLITVNKSTQTSVKSYIQRTMSNYVDGETIYHMVNEGSDVKAYEPYTGGVASPNPDYHQILSNIESPSISIYGKNLLKYPYVSTSKTTNGITFTDNGDGSVIVNGTATSRATFSFDEKLILPAGQYHVSGIPVSPGCTILIDVYDSGTWIKSLYDTGDGLSFTFDPTKDYKILINVISESVVNNIVVKPMIELNSEETSYEQFKSIQTLSVDYTLSGIPVSQNGNYTDSAGQQWVCDEIDFERGKYIQRIYVREFDGTEQWYVSSVQSNSNAVRYDLRDNSSPVAGNSYCLCTHFVHDGTNRIGVWLNNGETNHAEFRIQYKFTTLDELKAFLQAEYAEGTPVTFMYQLKTPIETDLTQAELQVFRELRTNSTNTTILNSSDATIRVGYVADLEKYIYKNVTIKQRLFDIILLETEWIDCGDGTYYTQAIDIGARQNGKIDLHPTADQILGMILDGISMFVSNEDGVATVYSVGSKPATDITIRATEQVVVYV